MLDELGVVHMNGRIYDPTIGRFMSADPFIQAPYELQSHNRYAYVMNNPLLYTDPSGFWSWRSIVIAVIVIVAVVVTMGAAAMAMGYATIAAATTGAYATLGSAMLVGAAGGFVGGFLGTALNGGSFAQSLKAGAIGAVAGAITGAVSYGASGMNTGVQIASKSVTSGAISKAQGGSFADGFKMALATSLAAQAYKNFVGWEASPNSGENQTGSGAACGAEGSNCYEFTKNDKIPADWQNKNSIGLNEPLNADDGSWSAKQSGGISQMLNKIPGMNAVAQFHDTLFSPNGLRFNLFNNVSTMLPAAMVTYVAIYDNVIPTKR
jgi:RHS repeat-associated protein